MTVPTIHNEPCDCPPGECAAGLYNDQDCINRQIGDVAYGRPANAVTPIRGTRTALAQASAVLADECIQWLH